MGEDFGTNYCDLKVLYCGSADGCKPVLHDFTVSSEQTKAHAGSNVDLKTCLATEDNVHSAVTSVQCPSTPSLVAAGMEITTTASASCDDVEAEIKARVAGQSTGKWHDPHNNGKYSIASFGGTLSTQRVTGNGKYTDHQIFTLTPAGDGQCKIEACSRSQVFSIEDFGTNYCDLKVLYCGSADGCKPVIHDFTVSSEATKKHADSNIDFKTCLATEDNVHSAVTIVQCPSTPSIVAAGMEVTTTASASCDDV